MSGVSKEERRTAEVSTLDLDQVKFEENRDETEQILTLACSDVEGIASDALTIKNGIGAVKDLLANVSAKYRPSISSSAESEAETLSSTGQSLLDNFREYAVILGSYLLAASDQVADFTYDDATKLINEMYQIGAETYQIAADNNAFWILGAAVEYYLGGKLGQYLGGCIAYGVDGRSEGGMFCVGDLAKGTIGKLIPGDKIGLINVSLGELFVGTGVAMAWTAIYGRLSDEGNWTDLDKKRLVADVAKAGLSYAEWVIVAGACGGGLPGAVAASIIAFVTMPVIDVFKDTYTGDRVVNTFELNGKSYEVPMNGNGENGTWDVISKRYKDTFGDRTIVYNGREYTENNFYELIKDPEVAPDIWRENQPSMPQSTPESVEYILDLVADAESPEEAAEIYEKHSHGGEGFDAYYCLDGLEFEPEKYWTSVHGPYTEGE